VSAVAPGELGAAVTLADRLAARFGYLDDQRLDAGAVPRVRAVAVGQARAQTALAIRLGSGCFVKHDRFAAMSYFHHFCSVALSSDAGDDLDAIPWRGRGIVGASNGTFPPGDSRREAAVAKRLERAAAKKQRPRGARSM